MRIPLSIIIPMLNEQRSIGACMESVAPLGGEVVVVDGGSSDGGPDIARDLGARLLRAPRGRGSQLRVGASASTGETLLFLHADSVLSRQARNVVAAAAHDPRFTIGAFRLRFDGGPGLCAVYAWFSRFDSVWTTFGDQGILIRREFYARVGGFPDWPLFEDVDLLRRARRCGPIRSLPAEVTTSARRFMEEGAIRRQIRNARMLARFLAGERPHDLALEYGWRPDSPLIEDREEPRRPISTIEGK